MALTLSQRHLGHLPETVGTPRYDRAALQGGIVHFGIGNFHRAHMAVYLDALQNQDPSPDWGIVGAGVRPDDAAMRDRLAAQDWLTTVVETDNQATTARVTGAMIGYLAPENPAAVVEHLSRPTTRIASLTITEGGYFIDPASGAFDADHAAMIADARNPTAPRTVFGILLAALARRRQAGVVPFTVLCCDNIPGNGNVTKGVLTGLARLTDPDLARWVEDTVACPNGMVDRITPATSERERQRLATEFGVADAAPVFCESFKQWVLEDEFTAGRPALERVGVTFVRDVEPFERMKMRILNASHAAIAYPAALLDLTYIHEAMGDPLLAGFLQKLGTDEIIPLVPPVPDTDLAAYLATVGQRFANPQIADTLRRVCFDGSNRQPKYVLPIVRDGLDRQTRIAGLALVSALWARYCYGETESGTPVEANDPSWERLREAARAARDEPRQFLLRLGDVFGDIGRHPRYVDVFKAALANLWSRGTRDTIQRYMRDERA